MNEQIQITDSIKDVLWKMSGGNPGALRVCMEILKDGERIDPDNALGGLGIILSLDTLGLRGPKIWMLYKDVCDCDLPRMLAVLRGWQLGFISQDKLRHAVDSYGEGISVPDICSQVTNKLPRFQLTTP